MKFSIAFVLCATSVASAQPVVYAEDEELDDTYADASTGMGLALGGGLYGFTSDTLRDTTTAGGNWTARLTFGLRAPLALEVAYIGSAQPIDALGIDDDAFLVSNGAQGNMRLNLAPTLNVTPFVYGGLAWRHYNIVNTDDNTSAISDSDEVFEFPIGVGISTQSEGLLIDLRGEFRYVSEEDMVPDLASDTSRVGDIADMHSWGVILSFGAEL